MSPRSSRLVVAAVAAATAIAVPAAALASGSSTSGKPSPSAAATKPASMSKPDASKSGMAGGSAAARKSAARQSAGSSTAMVVALAARLGVSNSAAQRALNQIEALGRGGVGTGSPPFAAIARDLGVSPAQLADALRAAKQSLAAK